MTLWARFSDDDGGWSSALTVPLLIGNTAPNADAGGPYDIAEGDGLYLDARASSDPGGDALTFDWDLDGDGAFDDETGDYVFVNWGELYGLGVDHGDAGGTAYEIELRVTDKDGGESTATAIINVTNIQ